MSALPRLLPVDLAEWALKPDDVVFARTGETAGKSVLIREYPENAVFARDYDDLFESNFINFGAKALMPMFSEDKLKSSIKICGSLEKELFAEA